MQKHAFTASIPVEVEHPPEMERWVRKVLEGEYEAPFRGSGLTILDIGANVGSFTLWANLRWPGSSIHAYEAEPATHELLERNVGRLDNVTCTQAAVYPTEEPELRFFSRYAGDGEAGLVDLTTFADVPEERVRSVPVVHPRELPRAHIVKVDAEGAEGAILESLDLGEAELVLVEYQTREDKHRIDAITREDFVVEHHEAGSWAELAGRSGYRYDIAGELQGVMVLSRRRLARLERIEAPPAAEVSPPRSLKDALRPLPGLTRAAVRRRLPDRLVHSG
jgi:FkbM family methyltransferase